MTFASLPLVRSLSAERRKYHKTMAMWLAVLAPMLIIALNFCIILFRGEHMIAVEDNAWLRWGNMNLNPSFLLLVPLYIVLLTVWFNQIEHQNHQWKHLWVLPVSRGTQYLAKVLMLLGLIGLSMLLFVGLVFGVGALLSVLRPDLGWAGDSATREILMGTLKGTGASLGIVGLQFWFSFRWRNLLAPVGLGMAGLISFLILQRWEHVGWHPFATPTLAFMRDQAPQIPADINPVLWGVLSGLLFFVLAYFEGSRKLLRS